MNFSFLGCLDLMLQRGLPLPSAAPRGNSPVLLGLRLPHTKTRVECTGRTAKQLEEMFASVHLNRFLFRVKEQPQGNMIVAQKTVQSKRIWLEYPYRLQIMFTWRKMLNKTKGIRMIKELQSL